MKKIEIYTKSTCPYCVKAKALFDKKKKTFVEYEITGNDTRRITMIQRANGAQTVPQIFIKGLSIGGCDELYHLEKTGYLDIMLSR